MCVCVEPCHACEPVWPSGKALGWFVDTVLWLCPSLPAETLKWLSSLPILRQESFWSWQCSDRYIISPPPPPYPLPPFSPSLISLMVSVDIKSHVYVLTGGESWGGRPGLSVLMSLMVSVDVKQYWTMLQHWSQLALIICQLTFEDIKQHNRTGGRGRVIVQELYESGGGHPGLSVLLLMSPMVSVEQYWTMLTHWSQLVPNMSTDNWGH